MRQRHWWIRRPRCSWKLLNALTNKWLHQWEYNGLPVENTGRLPKTTLNSRSQLLIDYMINLIFWEVTQSCWRPLFLIVFPAAPCPGRWKGTSSWREGKSWKTWAWEQCPKRAKQIHTFFGSIPSRSSRVKYLVPRSQICVICSLACGSWGRWQV